MSEILVAVLRGRGIVSIILVTFHGNSPLILVVVISLIFVESKSCHIMQHFQQQQLLMAISSAC